MWTLSGYPAVFSVISTAGWVFWDLSRLQEACVPIPVSFPDQRIPDSPFLVYRALGRTWCSVRVEVILVCSFLYLTLNEGSKGVFAVVFCRKP